MSVRIRGMAETKAALAKADEVIRLAAPEAVRAGAEPVAARMSSVAPRDTGRLASGVSVALSGSIGVAVATVGTDAPYDRFVQRGTKNMSAQPYAEAAANASASEVVTAQAAVYKAALNRVGG